MRFIASNKLFLTSILLGVMVWFFVFFLTPVNAAVSLSFEVIIFIILNYIVLIFGFIYADSKLKNFIQISPSQKDLSTFFYLIIIIVCLSSIVRFIDLFLVREISFLNTIEVNKHNSENLNNFSTLLGILGVFRMLYFVPYLLYVVQKWKNQKLLFICLLIFFIPIAEGYLRGSRRLIFEAAGFLVTINLIHRFSKLMSRKVIFILLLALIFVAIGSNLILKKRVNTINQEAYYKQLFKSPYNEFIPLNNGFKDYIINNNDDWKGSLSFTFAHIGQYYTHGIYEFDYMIKQKTQKKYGLYNAFIFVKLFNRLGISKIPLVTLGNPVKRITYITFFGGLYLDFGWFALIVMFFLGIIQNRIIRYSEINAYFQPLLVIILFTNFFLLVFNFIRAQMLISLFIYLLILIFFFQFRKYCEKIKKV